MITGMLIANTWFAAGAIAGTLVAATGVIGLLITAGTNPDVPMDPVNTKFFGRMVVAAVVVGVPCWFWW